jgi:Flp pilus assembly secretin CpaC
VKAEGKADNASPVISYRKLDHFKVRKGDNELTLVQNSSRMLKLDKNVPRVCVDNQEVVQVSPMTADQLLVRTVGPGAASIIIWDTDNAMYEVKVLVTCDTRELESHLQQLFPAAKVEVHGLASSVLLRGTVERPEDVPRMIEIAEDFYPKVINSLEVRAREAPKQAPPQSASKPSKLRDELRQLRAEVGDLRQDVKRLIDLLVDRAEAPPAGDGQPSGPSSHSEEEAEDETITERLPL